MASNNSPQLQKTVTFNPVVSVSVFEESPAKKFAESGTGRKEGEGVPNVLQNQQVQVETVSASQEPAVCGTVDNSNVGSGNVSSTDSPAQVGSTPTTVPVAATTMIPVNSAKRSGVGGSNQTQETTGDVSSCGSQRGQGSQSAPGFVEDNTMRQMNFRQLQNAINRIAADIQQQEKLFLENATKVNMRDKMLAFNGENISRLNIAVEKMKEGHSRVESSLANIKTQQLEFESILESLESGLPLLQTVPSVERKYLHELAYSVDHQLIHLGNDLKFVIESINAANNLSPDAHPRDPVNQILKILNEHTDALLWMDETAKELRKTLEDLGLKHSKVKKNCLASFSTLSLEK